MCIILIYYYCHKINLLLANTSFDWSHVTTASGVHQVAMKMQIITIQFEAISQVHLSPCSL